MSVQRDVLLTEYVVTDRGTVALETIAKKLEHVQATSDRVSRSMNFLSGALKALAAGAVVGSLAKGVYDTTVAFQQYEARLMTVLRSQEKVNEVMGFLRDFAASTPYELGEVTDAFTRMLAYGIEPTAEKFKTIGDFAASMGRSFSDAVEAVADASRGEFERMKEFGLTKEMVERFGQNLTNAKGQITDTKAFMEAMFQAMAERADGAMDRLSKTIPGKISTFQDTVKNAFLQIGKSIEGTMTQAIDLATRAVEWLTQPAIMNRITAFFQAAFNPETLKAFAKAVVFVGMSFARTFQFMQGVANYFTELNKRTNGWGLTLVALVGAGGVLMKLIGMLRAAGAAMRAFVVAQIAAVAFGNPLAASLRLGMAALAAVGAVAGLRKLTKEVIPDGLSNMWGDAGKTVDNFFKGLEAPKSGKTPQLPKMPKFGGTESKAAQALAQSGDIKRLPGNKTSVKELAVKEKTAADRIAEMILGGGQLARLGVKMTEGGPGFGGVRDNTIRVNVQSGDRDLSRAIEKLFELFLAQAVRQGKIVVPGS